MQNSITLDRQSSSKNIGAMPIYRERLTISDLKKRSKELRELLHECIVCPRECRARRTEGKYGVCRATDTPVISSAAPHYGEESPLVGLHGSGTIFFTSCNLKCLFCQNYEISQLRAGDRISPQQLSDVMLSLQGTGCHNINLVTPTHYTPQIAEALALAVDRGLQIPIVYNCGGYESVRTLKMLEDIVDIYMPDIKYSDDSYARKYSGVKNYWEVAQAAVIEMHRQVGDLAVDDNGIASRGLLIRHLVLPNRIAGSKKVLEFVAHEISQNSYVNIMNQYRPSFRSYRCPELNRSVTTREFAEVIEYAYHLGLHRGFNEMRW